jgi:hypothetical protein
LSFSVGGVGSQFNTAAGVSELIGQNLARYLDRWDELAGIKTKDNGTGEREKIGNHDSLNECKAHFRRNWRG